MVNGEMTDVQSSVVDVLIEIQSAEAEIIPIQVGLAHQSAACNPESSDKLCIPHIKAYDANFVSKIIEKLFEQWTKDENSEIDGALLGTLRKQINEMYIFITATINDVKSSNKIKAKDYFVDLFEGVQKRIKDALDRIGRNPDEETETEPQSTAELTAHGSLEKLHHLRDQIHAALKTAKDFEQ